MKKITLVCIIMSCMFGTLLNAQTNKIQNPGFEGESNLPVKMVYTPANGYSPGQWILACHENHATLQSLGEINTVTGEKNSGDKSMEVKLEKIGARYTFFLAYDIKGLTPGKYMLTFYSKADVADIPFRVDAIACGGTDYKTEKQLLGAAGSDENGIYPDNQAGYKLTTASSWQKHTIEFFASALSADDMGVVRLVIRPNCLKEGSSGVNKTPVTYWFDDFELINENETPIESGYPVFAAVSDIHFNRGGNWEQKVNRILPVLAAQNPKLDAIFMTGDITHNGTLEEFQLAKRIMDEQIPADIPVYYCMGNHDWWGSATESGNWYTDVFKQPLNQYIKIKGYPFILISMETKNASNTYGAKSRTFLSNTLLTAALEFPGKPIFVFMHVPNTGTVYGSYEIGGGDSWGTSDVKDILDNYPQAVVVSGHSHFFLSDERSIHQDKFTSINDGSLSYAETETGLAGGTRPKDSEKVLEGCFVSLTENNDVVVKRWDFYNNREIKQPWVISAPHDGNSFAYKNRDGSPAPYFAPSDTVSVAAISNSACKIQFPAAKDDDDVVQRYKIELLDENRQNVISTYNILSDFYLTALKSSFEWELTGLTENGVYYIRVAAIDAFGNESQPIYSPKTDLGDLSGVDPVAAAGELKVYPNPVKKGGAVSIAGSLLDNASGPVAVDIYDMAGVPVQNARLTALNTSVCMPLIPGIYILKLSVNETTRDFKLRVE